MAGRRWGWSPTAAEVPGSAIPCKLFTRLLLLPNCVQFQTMPIKNINPYVISRVVYDFLIEGGNAFALISILVWEADTSKRNLIFLSLFFPCLSDAVSSAAAAALVRGQGCRQACRQRRAQAGICHEGRCLRDIGNGNHEGSGAGFVALTLPCMEAQSAAHNPNGD